MNKFTPYEETGREQHLAAHAEDGCVARQHEQVSPGQARPVPQLGGLQQRPGLSSVQYAIIIIILVPSTN